MKAKTIKSALRAKINDWLASIDDEATRDLLAKNTIVTGGSIVSMLTGERVNDYDIYFRTHEAALAAANYYVAKFKLNPPPTFKGYTQGVEITVDPTEEREQVKIKIQSAGIASEAASEEDASGYQYFEQHPDEVGQEYVEKVMGGLPANLEMADEVAATAVDAPKDDGKAPYRPVFLSANAITLSHGVQLVMRFIGEPDVIHKFYDFVHCTCYWCSWDGKLELPAAALEAIITKELRYVGSRYPLCSIIRIRKFVARGWQINAGQILKMCWQLNQLDLADIKVLDDQLCGVDAHYFRQVIARLQEKQDAEIAEGKEPQPIDGTYLMTIIDRMF
jgi:hypothetical protein